MGTQERKILRRYIHRSLVHWLTLYVLNCNFLYSVLLLLTLDINLFIKCGRIFVHWVHLYTSRNKITIC